MRKITLLLFIAAFQPAFSQSKKDLNSQVQYLREAVESLRIEVGVLKEKLAQSNAAAASMENEISYLRNIPSLNSSPQTNQPLNYNSYNSTTRDSVNNKAAPANSVYSNGRGDGLTPTTGATIYTGPRGGHYYINSHGNKTYVRKH